MASLDDLPLDTGRGDAESAAPSAPSSPGPRVAIAAVLLTAAVAAGVWWVVTGRNGPGAPAADRAAAPAASTQAVGGAPMAEPPLPPLAQMDPVVREMLARLGSQPALLAWLATDDLVGGIAAAVDRLAQGQSPARDLAVLRPAGAFTTRRQAGATVIDPASYARYTPLVQAVTTVDPSALADVVVRLMPRLEEAYVAQGHPQGGFGLALRRAVEVVAATPDAPADAALVPGTGGLAYADPALEKLPAAQKHLLRMGPDHVRAVREAVRRFGAALPPAATAR